MTNLQLAKQGLAQIEKAYDDGEYEDTLQYVRDRKQIESIIARLERKES